MQELVASREAEEGVKDKPDESRDDHGGTDVPSHVTAVSFGLKDLVREGQERVEEPDEDRENLRPAETVSQARPPRRKRGRSQRR